VAEDCVFNESVKREGVINVLLMFVRELLLYYLYVYYTYVCLCVCVCMLVWV